MITSEEVNDFLYMILTGTITPWILGTLALFVLFTLANAVKAWHEMKKSPYFFMRRQAESRLQTYSFTSFGLILATLFITTYAWQPKQDNVVRAALLSNAKPPKAEITTMVSAAEPVKSAKLETPVVTTNSERFSPFAPSVLLGQVSNADIDSFSTPILPPEFNRLTPSVQLKDDTVLTPLQFSTEITEDYQPLNPRRIFAEGSFTVYATFAYEEMADGMEWSWVWRHDGSVTDGGNELWNYGDNGPGYVYLNPEEGFKTGKYSLEIWVNDELMSQSAITVNGAALSAGH